ncbi:MAG TPA: 2-C-methyl-D-erythritol 4-phosphate cytidylyltransferase [Burkholderiaceae bacterium]|nr:2-C-methyl-D-erythritol 4-phosphate cytidylyltransferase [Burkholderiaceae bacterium]
MRSDRPKQYLSLGSRTMLERSIEGLLADARVVRTYIVVAREDGIAASLPLPARCEILVAGGGTRAESVRNGLRVISNTAAIDDWVLVHDAARPCLQAAELSALIDGVGGDEHGGLLAVPLSDTVKRAHEGRVAQTVERTGLWRALTPQFFRIDVLSRALDQCPNIAQVTDEAAAVELLGLHPRLIEGSTANIKVTTADDMLLAEAILRQQGRW